MPLSCIITKLLAVASEVKAYMTANDLEQSFTNTTAEIVANLTFSQCNYPAPGRHRERGIVFARFLSLFLSFLLASFFEILPREVFQQLK